MERDGNIQSPKLPFKNNLFYTEHFLKKKCNCYYVMAMLAT